MNDDRNCPNITVDDIIDYCRPNTGSYRNLMRKIHPDRNRPCPKISTTMTQLCTSVNSNEETDEQKEELKFLLEQYKQLMEYQIRNKNKEQQKPKKNMNNNRGYVNDRNSRRTNLDKEQQKQNIILENDNELRYYQIKDEIYLLTYNYYCIFKLEVLIRYKQELNNVYLNHINKLIKMNGDISGIHVCFDMTQLMKYDNKTLSQYIQETQESLVYSYNNNNKEVEILIDHSTKSLTNSNDFVRFMVDKRNELSISNIILSLNLQTITNKKILRYINEGFTYNPILDDRIYLSLTYNLNQTEKDRKDAYIKSCLLYKIYNTYRKYKLTVDQEQRTKFRKRVLNLDHEIGVELEKEVNPDGVVLKFPPKNSLKYKTGRRDPINGFIVSGHMTGNYQIHSHPYICYNVLDCYIGWPSGLDYRAVLDEKDTILHIVESIEGSYTIHITPEARSHFKSLEAIQNQEKIMYVKYKLIEHLKQYQNKRHMSFPIYQIHAELNIYITDRLFYNDVITEEELYDHIKSYVEMDNDLINLNKYKQIRLSELLKQMYIDMYKISNPNCQYRYKHFVHKRSLQFHKNERIVSEIYKKLKEWGLLGPESNYTKNSRAEYVRNINQIRVDSDGNVSDKGVTIFNLAFFTPEEQISIDSIDCIGDICTMTQQELKYPSSNDVNRLGEDIGRFPNIRDDCTILYNS